MAAAAAIETAATSPMIHPFTREEAEEALRRYPMRPLLRTCSYTPSHPRIHAITYREAVGESGETRILHSLVELDPNGQVHEIRARPGGALERTGITYESTAHLMQIVERHQRRLLLHTRSLPTAVEAAIVLANAAETSSDLDEEVMYAFAARAVEEGMMTG